MSRRRVVVGVIGFALGLVTGRLLQGPQYLIGYMDGWARATSTDVFQAALSRR